MYILLPHLYSTPLQRVTRPSFAKMFSTRKARMLGLAYAEESMMTF